MVGEGVTVVGGTVVAGAVVGGAVVAVSPVMRDIAATTVGVASMAANGRGSIATTTPISSTTPKGT